jgi:long-chain acyl-CoA synthetase
MKLLEILKTIWKGIEYPFLIYNGNEYFFNDILSQKEIDLSLLKRGDVVAIIGGFNPFSILTLLNLIDLGVIVVPLTIDTINDHDFFFESALVDFIIKDGAVKRRIHKRSHELISQLREKDHGGLVLFSTGTSGHPKAILHDLTLFLKRFVTPRSSLKTINFLLFDHIGGINTLLHTLFNKGVVVSPDERTIESVLETCDKYDVELLPTTPTFLRMMLMSGAVPSKVPSCLSVITYGTERMDQTTLDELCQLLPNVDFRQTYGMSELGILRVKSESRNSLYMKLGGEGLEIKVVNKVLQIRSESRMLGYLNAPSPFDSEGWYDTKDIVKERNGFYKIVGRKGDVINVGGLKFMASEVERVALAFPNISLVKAYGKENPITGQHVEIMVQPKTDDLFDKNMLMVYLKSKLQSHMVPKRIRVEDVTVGHRFKRA